MICIFTSVPQHKKKKDIPVPTLASKTLLTKTLPMSVYNRKRQEGRSLGYIMGQFDSQFKRVKMYFLLR